MKPILEVPYKEYRKNYTNYRTTERNIQLIADTAVDINDNFILAKNVNPIKLYVKLQRFNRCEKQKAGK